MKEIKQRAGTVLLSIALQSFSFMRFGVDKGLHCHHGALPTFNKLVC